MAGLNEIIQSLVDQYGWDEVGDAVFHTKQGQERHERWVKDMREVFTRPSFSEIARENSKAMQEWLRNRYKG